MEKEQVSVSQEISNFIVNVLRHPQTKESPEMVAAIAELYKANLF